jgi:hypothetical protein
MLVVSGRYQNYQNGAVSNQLTDIERGENVFSVGGDSSKSVSIHCYLHTLQSNSLFST